MIKEAKTTTEVITHRINYDGKQYWEINYSYRNGDLKEISMSFNGEETRLTDILNLAKWRVEGDIVHVLAKLVYYFKTKKFENMFPNIKFTDPEENEDDSD